jgi:signal peptidase I
MIPTIKIDDRIFVTRIYDRSKLQRGDIVVFYSKELKDTLIKRLIGLPGETVEVKDNGDVYVNGTRINEPYVVYPDIATGKYVMGKDQFLFFGDNRAISLDARKWVNPYIDGKDIKGKARFVVFPFSRMGKFVVGAEAINK